MPGGGAAEKLKVFGVFDDGEPFGQPALVEQELPVDPREDSAVHQQVTQVSDGSPGGFLVRAVTG